MIFCLFQFGKKMNTKFCHHVSSVCGDILHKNPQVLHKIPIESLGSWYILGQDSRVVFFPFPLSLSKQMSHGRTSGVAYVVSMKSQCKDKHGLEKMFFIDKITFSWNVTQKDSLICLEVCAIWAKQSLLFACSLIYVLTNW